MRRSPRLPTRHDPRTIYEVHKDRATGLTASEIAVKHGLSPMTVLGVLRPTSHPEALRNPYVFHSGALPTNAALQMYWLGYIAAGGRVAGQHLLSTLVLAIHPQDTEHVQWLLKDLGMGRVRCEVVESSLEGRQVYIRDRSLAETLLQWGIAAAPNEGSVPVEFIPRALVPDFVRGYLEGSRRTPPFGGTRAVAPSPRSLRSLALAGPLPLMEGLNQALQAICGVRTGTLGPSGHRGLTQLTFSRRDAVKILACAYRRPLRTGPRAVKFAARFGDPDGRQRGSGPAGT
ncbi:MAG: hypothetical protein QN168_05790 [Armatimonadota bacterium]|nr:hypothetical protein [Armatimonadota bacterium]